MTDIELSLDEIIKKRNIRTPNTGTKMRDNRKPTLKRLSDGPKPAFIPKPVADARYKIMKNQRLRENIDGPAIADARFRLEAMRNRNRGVRRPSNGAGVLRRTVPGAFGNPLLTRRVPIDVDMYDIDRFEVDPFKRDLRRRPELMTSGPLLRTVENDHPGFSRRPFDWDRPVEEDEMDVDMIVNRRNPGFRPGSEISITVATPHSPLLPPPGILKRPAAVPTIAPAVVPPKAIKTSGLTLSERFNRDRNVEAAVKVEALKAQLKAAKGEATSKPEGGHRIVVSNLVASVTHEDVKELFADIGELVTSKLVRPGVAEVVYHDLEDAVKAVDVYHNRQLDGQPMKCLLVKNQSKKPRPVELDMATLRNALHKKTPS